ncbi:MAG: helix-turn-helix domain-containing protein [Spirochaetia bacterium]|jgi:two-component system response regulator YesN|nr:helix-turn-helix domain-containing protein [Spirochaetia bacterium]
MAISIFLAEDELIIRRSISKNIDWESEGFEFLGAAADGELALPLVLAKKPDILITDIKMPFLDGLQLSELVKKKLPKTKILLLTGYKDFDFAKKAISIGVTDYILKPITTEKLISRLQDIAWDIENERENSRLLETYKAEKAERKTASRNNFFAKLISNIYTFQQLLDKAKDLDLDLVGTQYAILLLKMTFRESNLENEQKINELEQHLPLPDGWITFDRGAEGLGILCINFEPSEWKKEHDLLCNYLDQNEGLTYFGAVGPAVKRLTEISQSYQKASKAFASRFFIDRDNIIESYDAVGNPEEKLGTIPLFRLDSDNIDRTIIERFLQLGQQEEEGPFITDYLQKFDDISLDSLDFRHYLMMDTYFCCSDFLCRIGYTKADLKPLDIARLQGCSRQKLASCLSELLRQTLQLRDSVSHSTHSTLIENTKRFMEGHYNSKQMALNYVADEMGISPNYLSTLFSNETGETFTEYLTKLKMEKAIELLLSTDMRSSEIAIAIGYQDPHYFSHMFKKYTGLSPRGYRTRKSQ